MKIAIIGYSGSGKSTLARKLGEKYGLPVLHLDTVHWLPGWKARERDEKDRIIKEYLDTHISWVIDGTYSRFSFERRMEEADVIIELLFGRVSCYIRALKRHFKYRGTNRPDMTVGCPEKMDWEFTKWIFVDGRKKSTREKFASVRDTYPNKTLVIKNQRALDRLDISDFAGKDR